MSPDIEVLIQKISRLPNLGARSARRIVIHLIQHNKDILEPMLRAMQRVHDSVKVCPICGNVDAFDKVCSICANPKRHNDSICVVASVADLWAIERTACFKGKYHVLTGLLSALNNKGPEALHLEKLYDRCMTNGVTEIISALSATVEGRTTDYFIRDYFKKTNIKISALAHGIPIGGELDYLDNGTLYTAFTARK